MFFSNFYISSKLHKMLPLNLIQPEIMSANHISGKITYLIHIISRWLKCKEGGSHPEKRLTFIGNKSYQSCLILINARGRLGNHLSVDIFRFDFLIKPEEEAAVKLIPQ